MIKLVELADALQNDTLIPNLIVHVEIIWKTFAVPKNEKFCYYKITLEDKYDNN